MPDNLKITRWLRDGNNGLSNTGVDTTYKLLERAGWALDRAESSEIMGEIFFQAEDGIWYVGTVEFLIEPANPTLIQDLLEEDEGEDEGTADESAEHLIHHSEAAAMLAEADDDLHHQMLEDWNALDENRPPANPGPDDDSEVPF